MIGGRYALIKYEWTLQRDFLDFLDGSTEILVNIERQLWNSTRAVEVAVNQLQAVQKTGSRKLAREARMVLEDLRSSLYAIQRETSFGTYLFSYDWRKRGPDGTKHMTIEELGKRLRYSLEEFYDILNELENYVLMGKSKFRYRGHLLSGSTADGRVYEVLKDGVDPKAVAPRGDFHEE
jgi:hypothetical protein